MSTTVFDASALLGPDSKMISSPDYPTITSRVFFMIEENSRNNWEQRVW